MTVAERALEFVKPGDRIGLGTGHAASGFARALAARIREGLNVRAVPTSEETAEQARELGIPLTTLDEVELLDLAVDGADEVDPRLDLIKGYGGALVRERVVASSSRCFVILVGAEKLVPVLGARGTLPVEVIPFALPTCTRSLAHIGIGATPRMNGGRPFVTDNGNYLLECSVGPMANPGAMHSRVRSIPGVVDSGLFLDLAHVVLVQAGDDVKVLRRSRDPGEQKS